MSSLALAESTPKRQEATKEEAASSPQAAADEQGATQQPTPLDWLNKAVAYAPDSAEALVNRARFHRQSADAPDANEATRRAALTWARRDLEAADALGTDDPRLRYSLGEEWMLLGELERSSAELQAADKLPKDRFKEQFFDADAAPSPGSVGGTLGPR
jgi:hypothetical protein